MTTIDTLLQEALARHQAGDFDRARQLYCTVLERDPRQADAWHLLGLVSHQAGDRTLAAELIERALALQPQDADYRNSLGVVLLEQKRLPEAVAAFQQVLALQPDHVLGRMNLGNALLEQGQARDALHCYDAVLERCPTHAQTHNNRGNALKRLGQLEPAAASYQRAVELQPDLLEARSNLGTVLSRLGRHQEALALYRDLLERQPRVPSSYFNVGSVLHDLGRWQEAVTFYEEALRREPRYVLAHTNLGILFGQQGLIPAAVAHLRQAYEIDPEYQAAASNYLFYLNYDPRLDPAAVFTEHRAWGERQEAQAPPARPYANERSPQRRLRIGYVSPDLRSHALCRFFEPVLANHDPARVEVTCYAEVARPDAVTERLQQHAARWRSTCGRSDEEVATQVRADTIDILVDLAGHTASNRLRLFTHRPAPIQATWLGYPNTTGLRSIDYLLTDDGHHPAGSETLCTEEVIRLPRGLSCFTPPPEAPEVGPLPALRNGYLTFGSLHNLGKLNPTVLDLWARLLHAVPSARLLIYRDTLVGPVCETLRRQFHERGLRDNQIDLRGGAVRDGYLSVYHEIDVSLDVFPYGGGTTIYEALWLGVPTLTVCGDRFCSRGGAAALRRVNLADLIAHSPDEFVTRGARLMQEVERLAAVRAGLRVTAAATVCDAVGFTRALEEVYRDLWRRWLTQPLARGVSPPVTGLSPAG